MTGEIVFLCRQCGGVVEPRKDADGGGRWVCLSCGHVYGVWLDEGELDLGLVREPGA